MHTSCKDCEVSLYCPNLSRSNDDFYAMHRNRDKMQCARYDSCYVATAMRYDCRIISLSRYDMPRYTRARRLRRSRKSHN